jgi:hypothetical protein
MKIQKLVLISILGRSIVGLFGIIQLRAALPVFGISGFAEIAAATTLLTVGIVLESGLAWNLRLEISQSSSENINNLVRKTFLKLVLICAPLCLITFAVMVTSNSVVTQLNAGILFMTFGNLIFIPWLRLLEGIGLQYVTILIQVATSFIILLIVVATVHLLNIVEFTLLISSSGLMSSIVVLVYIRMRIQKKIPDGASHNKGDFCVKIPNLDSLVVVFSSNLLFGFYPLLYHLYKNDDFVSQTGIRVRLFSLMLGVIGVIGTQLQVKSAQHMEGLSYGLKIRILTSVVLIFTFVGADFILEAVVFGRDNPFNIFESVSFGVLVALVESQIYNSTLELKQFGLKRQVLSYSICTIIFAFCFVFIRHFDLSLVWATCLIFYIVHVRPLGKRVGRPW